jgi:hypothetical protein
MDKLDFKIKYKHLYQPAAKAFALVDVPPLEFLMVDGHGDPNTAPAYQEAVEALYAVSYKLKFMSKKERGTDYVVPPLEGLWWAQDMQAFTTLRDKSAWDWTMMIMQPDWIDQGMFAKAIEAARKSDDRPGLSRLRLEKFHEGLAAQILHLGSYEAEAPVIARMHAFIHESGYQPSGKHHEIYLSDPRKVPPEKLKTVLRQPVKK